MSHSVRVLPAAEEELSEAWRWYESQRDGLGDQFLMCVEAAIASAARNPEMYAPVHRSVRRVLTRRFPYGVFFILEPPTVTVIAIFRASRDSRQWKERT